MKKYKTTIIITTNFPIHWQHIGEATEPQTDGPAKHFLSSECRSS